LPGVYCEMIERCDIEGMSGARVARQLGYSPRQFYRVRRRALAALVRAAAEGSQAEPHESTDYDAQVRLGRSLLAHCADPDAILPEPQCREIVAKLRERTPQAANLSALARRIAWMAIDDMPARLRVVAVGTIARVRNRELAHQAGVSLRQVYRIRREAMASTWQAFCRRLDRGATSVTCIDVRTALARRAIALHQVGESTRAREALRAVFEAADDPALRSALLLPMVELECANADYVGARSAIRAVDQGACAAAFGDERDIAAAFLELRSGSWAEPGQLRRAVWNLELLEQAGNGRARVHALVQGYILISETRSLTGGFREASAAAERALALCTRIEDPEPMLHARALRARGESSLFRPGRLAEGIRYLQRSYEWCVEADLWRERVAATYDLGGAFTLAGNFAKAIDRYRQVLRTEDLLSPSERFSVRLDHVNALARLGRLGLARATLGAIEREPDCPLAGSMLAISRAQIDLLDDPETALRRSVVVAERAGHASRRFYAAARFVEAEALFALGRYADSSRVCLSVLELVSQHCSSAMLARALRLAARLTGSTSYQRAADEIGAEFASAFSD